MSARKALSVVPPTPPTASEPDPYNALTLTLEELDALTAHLTERLFDLGSYEDTIEIYALALIARHLHDLHARVGEHAEALLAESRR